MSVDLREPPGSVSKEVGGVHGSVQGVQGTENPQLPRLGSEMSRGPAHGAAQAGPGTVIHQQPHQVRPPWQRTGRGDAREFVPSGCREGGHAQLVRIPPVMDFTHPTICFII